MAGEWRYIAQRIPSGEFLDWNVPLQGSDITRSLSAPGRLSGDIPLSMQSATGPDGYPLYEEWGTAIWAEVDNEIRGGGILVATDIDPDNDAFTVDCMGISGYPGGLPWTGTDRDYVRADPAQVYRDVWSHVQGQPGGNLGIEISNTTTPTRIGEPRTEDNDDDGPFELRWYETKDLGGVLDEMANAGPFDYIEHTRWSGDALAHRIDLHYPFRGRRLTTPSLVIGANVRIPDMSRGHDYANEVALYGAGEGRELIHARQTTPSHRLRRVAVVERPEITRVAAARSEARAELQLRQGFETVQSLSLIDHPNAPIGSFDIGDELFLRGHVNELEVAMWVRVLELSFQPDNPHAMELTVARSEVIT